MQAGDNAAAAGPTSITVIHADILDLPKEKKYDGVVSNPPFYEQELSSPDEGRKTAHHSLQLGLGQLLGEIKSRLHTGGSFFLLLPFKRRKEIEEAFTTYGLFVHKQINVSLAFDRPPTRLMIQGSLQEPDGSITESLCIRDGKGGYSEAFVDLLQDYYLYL
jgi:tRNA1Val (adenine37-N6)-methyltransferase